MIELAIETKNCVERLAIPESWNEVPMASRLFCIRQLLTQPDDKRARLAIIRKLFKRQWRSIIALSDHQVADILKLTDGIGIKADPEPVIPSFKHKGVIYFLPKEKARNLTAFEYPVADGYYEQYVIDHDESALLYLVATLAREGHGDQKLALKTGDVRTPLLSRLEIEHRANMLGGLAPDARVAVLMYFAGVKQYIHDLYGKWLFNQPIIDDEEEDSEPDAEAGGSGMFGWWGMYMTIAESGVFGNLDQVHQSNFHSICMYAVKKKEEEWEARRQMEATKQKHFIHE